MTPALYATTFRAMGCTVNLWLETAGDGPALLAQAAGRIAEIEATLSRFRPDSELSRLNAEVGAWQVVGDVLFENVCAAKQGARLTDGLYNPLVLDSLERAGYDRSFELLNSERPVQPPQALGDWRAIDLNLATRSVRLPARLDLGGVAKGWTAQVVAGELANAGPCLVDIGGDLVTRGIPAGQTGWPVAVTDPLTEGAALLTLSVRDQAVVTSGADFRRWGPERRQHHLIDPRTGAPAHTDIVAVTIVHPDAVTAEVYAKAVFLQGSAAGLDWLNDQWDGSGLVVRADGAVLVNTRFESWIAEGVAS